MSSQLSEAAENRLVRLAQSAVRRMQLDLSGMRVLTEAASSYFAVTPLLAAAAAADQVVAVTRDSRWGSAEAVIEACGRLAERAGVSGKISFRRGSSAEHADGCDLVTNLGFVRPIGRALLERLSASAAIALMWEPWEFRHEDIDLAACTEFGIPIVGTAEAHPYVRTLDYLGPAVGRLLLDHGVEIVGSRTLVVGSDPFGSVVGDWLKKAGASVEWVLGESWAEAVLSCGPGDPPVDAVILVEHRSHDEIVGSKHAVPLSRMAAWGAPIVRVCGVVDPGSIAMAGVALVPDAPVAPGYMTITTAHAGPRPVVDLHAAGLMVGSLVVRGRRSGLTGADAVELAVRSGYGLPLEDAP